MVASKYAKSTLINTTQQQQKRKKKKKKQELRIKFDYQPTRMVAGTLIRNHKWRINTCRFQWPWVTPNPGFKVTHCIVTSQISPHLRDKVEVLNYWKLL